MIKGLILLFILGIVASPQIIEFYRLIRK